MVHEIRCPHCDAKLRLADDAVGREKRCPKCGEGIITKARPADVAEEPALPVPRPYFALYFGLEMVFGWLSLIGWVLAAVVGDHTAAPSSGWLVSCLLAIAVGRLSAIHFVTLEHDRRR